MHSRPEPVVNARMLRPVSPHRGSGIPDGFDRSGRTRQSVPLFIAVDRPVGRAPSRQSRRPIRSPFVVFPLLKVSPRRGRLITKLLGGWAPSSSAYGARCGGDRHSISVGGILRKSSIATGFALAIVAPVIGATPAMAGSSSETPRTYEGTVTEVIDGDSIRVSGIGGSVRLIGVWAAEPGGCFYGEAKDFAAAQLNGKHVTLRTDSVNDETDHRLFAYVFLDGELFNLETVRQGYARERAYGPDYELRSDFLKAEDQAEKEDLGRWDAC
jgi:endonuclease YncB( thermonuclease family)